jgi:predicted enzyme related to lactoylglutathione lyase
MCSPSSCAGRENSSVAERVTGIGGVFFRAQDPKALVDWYREHLGVPLSSDGYVVFPESRDTHWVPFPHDTGYWPREKEMMVNFTVADLDAMLEQLRAAGVEVADEVEEMEFGRFGWARDPEGNRFELWEPPATGP